MESLSHDGVTHGQQKVNGAKALTPVNASPLRNYAVDQRSEPDNHLSIDHRRTRKLSGGSEHSVDRSPLRPHHQPRSTGSVTPGRTRPKPAVDFGATVPKLSDLDENDPTSAENLTGIFNRIRDEKKHGPKPPMITVDPEFDFDSRRRTSNSDSGCFCFRWFSK